MSNYLQKVRELIDSSEVAEQTIDEINEVDFPKSATVLESLVYGESKQLESVRREQEVSPEDSDDPAEVAHLILAKIKTYTDKLDKGFEFKYQFALCATYQHLGETKKENACLLTLSLYIKSWPKKIPKCKLCLRVESSLVMKLILILEQIT
jgi:hypothetical protein